MTTGEKGPCCGIRYIQTLLLFFNFLITVVLRHNLNVALVAMTNGHRSTAHVQSFDWTEQQKAYIKSSFYWGYIPAQVPGIFICRLIGVKWLLATATFAAGLSCGVVPLCLESGKWEILCLLRVCQGISQGFIGPTWMEHIAKWTPPPERNCIGTLTISGAELGSVVASLLCGFLAASSLGWPYVFYITAACTAVWLLPWVIWAANNPSKSRFITKEERQYIESSLNMTHDIGDEFIRKKHVPIPWKAICTSAPFVTLLFTRMAHAWGYSILQIQLPAYFDGVMDVDMQSNALFTSFPFIALWLCDFLFLALAHVIMVRQCMSLLALRKTFNTIAFWIPAAAYIMIGFIEMDHVVYAIVLTTVIGGISAAQTIGSYLNTIDLTVNHAGTCSVMVSMLSNIISLITPLFVGLIVTDKTNREQWLIVFVTTAVVYILGNIGFLIWGSVERQPWDDPDYVERIRAQKEKERKEKEAPATPIITPGSTKDSKKFWR